MTSRFLVSILHENLLQQQVAPLLASPALPSSPLRQCSFATEFFLVHCCCTTSGDGAPKDFVVHKCYWKERRQLPASRPQRVCGAAPRRLFSSSWTDTFVGCEVEAVLNASLQFCSANWPRSHRVCWQKTGPTADRKERVLVFLVGALCFDDAFSSSLLLEQTAACMQSDFTACHSSGQELAGAPHCKQ